MSTKKSSTKERRTYHCIKPRYTPGIPSTVDYEFAKQFTIEERNEYRKCLRGEYGEENRVRAERLGLEGIAQTKIKRIDKKGDIIYWSIMDLITNKEHDSMEGPPDQEFKPLYILAIEIQKDWDSPDLVSSQLIKLLRRVNVIGETTTNSFSPSPITAIAEEIVIKLLIQSTEWKTARSHIIKKELRNILCSQISKIENENLKAMAKVICKRFE